MTDYTQLYIGGAWVDPVGTGHHEVIDPTTEQVYATVPEGVAADADRAVAAAKEAFEGWASTAPTERAKHLRLVADGIEARKDELSDIESHEIGTPRSLSPFMQVGLGTAAFLQAADALDAFEFEDRSNGLVVREPIGVVAAITPWNYPLNQIGAKVAYALAAGCTVVLKPSEVAPVNAFVLAEIVDDIGIPGGVFNLLTGPGPVVGEALAAHPDVDMVSFTGSTRAGRRVAELAAATVKRVALELGGKSPNVILDDAPEFEKAVTRGVRAAYFNSGQTCSALTRMIVPRSRLAEVEEIARVAAESHTVGDPFAEDTRLGPLVSEVQRDRVRGYIRTGIDEGATLVTGGAEAPDGLDTGYFVRPTVFSDVTARHDGRAGGDLRAGARDHAVRHRGRSGGDRQRQHLRPRCRCVGQRRAGAARRATAACGPGRDQREPRDPGRAVRGVQAVRPRPRARRARARRVPRGQGDLRVRCRRSRPVTARSAQSRR